MLVIGGERQFNVLIARYCAEISSCVFISPPTYCQDLAVRWAFSAMCREELLHHVMNLFACLVGDIGLNQFLMYENFLNELFGCLKVRVGGTVHGLSSQ